MKEKHEEFLNRIHEINDVTKITSGKIKPCVRELISLLQELGEIYKKANITTPSSNKQSDDYIYYLMKQEIKEMIQLNKDFCLYISSCKKASESFDRLYKDCIKGKLVTPKEKCLIDKQRMTISGLFYEDYQARTSSRKNPYENIDEYKALAKDVIEIKQYYGQRVFSNKINLLKDRHALSSAIIMEDMLRTLEENYVGKRICDEKLKHAPKLVIKKDLT